MILVPIPKLTTTIANVTAFWECLLNKISQLLVNISDSCHGWHQQPKKFRNVRRDIPEGRLSSKMCLLLSNSVSLWPALATPTTPKSYWDRRPNIMRQAKGTCLHLTDHSIGNHRRVQKSPKLGLNARTRGRTAFAFLKQGLLRHCIARAGWADDSNTHGLTDSPGNF